MPVIYRLTPLSNIEGIDGEKYNQALEDYLEYYLLFFESGYFDSTEHET